MNKNKKIFIITLTFLMLVGLTTIAATDIDTNYTTTITQTSQANTIDTTTETTQTKIINQNIRSTDDVSTSQTDNIQETTNSEEILNNKTGEKTQNLKASRTVTANNFNDLNSSLRNSTYDTVTINIGNNIQLAGNITVNDAIKTLTINGNGKTINGNDQYRFLDVTLSNVTINNLTITQCYAYSGAAIIIQENSTLIVTNSRFTNNNATFGGAIYSLGNVTVTNSNFTYNSASWGGAIFSRGNVTVTNSSFTHNKAIREGGVLLTRENTTSTVTNSNFAYNSASWGGATHTKGILSIINSSLTHNNATSSGGAVYGYSNSTVMIQDSNLTNNSANSSGGAICANENSTIIVINSNLTHNNATERGGAIYVYSNDIILKNSNIIGNNVTNNTGYVVRLHDVNSVIITDNTFINNTDNVRDMLFSDVKEGAGVDVHGNTYTDNFLEVTIVEPDIAVITDNEAQTYNYYIDLKLRDVYNDTVSNGTLKVYVNGVLKDTTDVINGRARILFNNGDLTNRENNITLEYISPSKNYQNVTTVFTVKKEINTTLSIQAPTTMNAGETAQINFTLVDVNNNRLSGETIHVFVNEEQVATVTTDQNGVASYNFSALGDKRVPIEATHHTSADSIYLSAEDVEAEIKVNKIQQRIEIQPGDITPHVESNIAIILFMPNGTSIKNKTVTVNITEEGKPDIIGTVTTNENGVAVFNFTPVDEGTLNITVTSPSDDIYHYKSETVQASKNFITTEMRITPTDTPINQTNTISIQVLPRSGLLNGTVELNISGEIHNITISNGNGEYNNYKSDTSGEKLVTAKFISDNPGYANATMITEFRVNKLPTRVTIEAVNRTAGNVTLKVQVFPKDDISSVVDGGNIVIESVNGETRTIIYDGTLVNGELINLTDVNETGWYEFEVEYHGNDYFLGDMNSTGSIEVLPVNTITVTENKTTLVGDIIILNASVIDADGNPVNDGNVKFYIDGSPLSYANGTPVEVKVENGIATTEYSLPAEYRAGNHTISANYTGSSKYNTSSGRANLHIDLRDTSMTVTPPVNNTKGNTTIEVTLNSPTEDDKPVSGAEVIVTDSEGNEVGWGVTDENGTAIIKLNIPTGENNLTITYPGDEIYGSQEETTTINVTPRESEITGKVINNTVGNVTVDVQVVDAETGEPITGQVNIIVADEIVGTGNLDDEGRATIPTDIDVKGNYTIILEYMENDDYQGSSDTLDNVDVVGKDVDMNVTVENSTVGNTTLNVTISDPETGEPIPNATVVVTLPNGTDVNGTTDENGTAIIPVDMPVGDNNITISYPGNDTYNPQEETTIIDVTPRESETTGTVTNDTVGNVTIDVEVVDPVTGEPVTGPVNITIDGKVVGNGTLDDEGRATIPVDIDKKGNYTIVVEYGGNDDYEGSNDTLDDVSIKGKDVDMNVIVDNQLVENTTLNVTIDDPETGEPIPNATVVVTLPNGTNVTGTTDENGTAIITIDVPSGDNNLTITYPGDDEHEAEQINRTVKVKSYSVVTVDAVEGVVLDNVTFTANVVDYNDNKVTGGYVVFKVGGRTLTDANGNQMRTLVENGVAKLSYQAESGWIVDSHPNLSVQATYSGTSIVMSNRSDTSKVTIYKRNATVMVSAPDDYVNGTLYIDAVVRDQNGSLINDGVLVFKLNGLSLKDVNNKGIVAKVANGKVHVDVKLPFAYSAKTYNLTATYSNKIYNKVIGSNTTSLKAIPTYVNATVTIKDQFSKPVVTGQIYNKFNDAILEGTAIINIKFDGISYAKKVKVNNGTFRETLEGIPIYKPGTHKVEVVAGANSHYEAVRKTITTKATPKYNVNTVFTNITRNKTTTQVQARIVDDKNKNVQRNLSITIKLNGKSFLINRTVVNGIVDVLIDTSTLKNRNYTLELVSGANTYYNAGKSTAELPKY